MSGNFYIISLGPGNPELITIQALKALHECQIVFVSNRSKDNNWEGSVSYKIIQNIYNTYEKWFENSSDFLGFIRTWQKKLVPIYTPMSYSTEAWNDQIAKINEACQNHSKVGYVTIGDAGIHSSVYYILDIIKQKHKDIFDNTTIIPGISSFSYASSIVKKPLCVGNTKLEVLPLHSEKLETTTVYMRLHKGQDLTDLKGDNLYYFKNLGLENEQYGEGSPGIIDNYLTLVVDFANHNNEKEMKD